MALSFADDIRSLFRDSPDIDSMKDFGLDLSSYEDVKAQAGVIYARLADGSMPCDDPWPKEQIELFKPWMDEGMAARAPTATGPCSAFSSTSLLYGIAPTLRHPRHSYPRLSDWLRARVADPSLSGRSNTQIR
jgi:hypothetical protein